MPGYDGTKYSGYGMVMAMICSMVVMAMVMVVVCSTIVMKWIWLWYVPPGLVSQRSGCCGTLSGDRAIGGVVWQCPNKLV